MLTHHRRIDLIFRSTISALALKTTSRRTSTRTSTGTRTGLNSSIDAGFAHQSTTVWSVRNYLDQSILRLPNCAAVSVMKALPQRRYSIWLHADYGIPQARGRTFNTV